MIHFRTFSLRTAIGLGICHRHCSSSSLSNVTNAFSLRSHTCGELRLAHIGHRVKLFGWLRSKRMNKFIFLHDAYGAVQAVLQNEQISFLKDIPPASSLSIEGTVIDRGHNRNNAQSTGDIEVLVDKLEVLNPSLEPLPVRDESIESSRLAHRYLDLRTSRMQNALRLRAKVISRMRRTIEDKYGFIDVQTPTLAFFTPGGANEFPVPATKLGEFFSLPQSPQIYKQLLMCGAVDKYYQMAICYRDEDAKPDRQPEFTQLDLEMSFTNQNSIVSLVEQVIMHAWPEEMKESKPTLPFRRMSYAEAITRFGTDKPDMRIPWEIFDCPSAHISDNEALKGKYVKMFIAKGASDHLTPDNLAMWKERIERIPRKQECMIVRPGSPELSMAFPSDPAKFLQEYKIVNEDAIAICWGNDPDGVLQVLGCLRNLLAEAIGLRTVERFEFLWVQDFPLFTRNESTNVLESTHHPFTAPIPEHFNRLKEGKDLDTITAQHYDLVLNGVEVGGGSIRIHNADLQRIVLKDILKLDTSHLTHFLNALSYGAPPHGGFALGIDRYIAILGNAGDTNTSIRDVIAFPKASSGRCLLTDSPRKATKELLERYGLEINK